MIEQKLYQAAQESPELEMHYFQIEEKARYIKKKRIFSSLKGLRMAAAMGCVILLLTTTVLAATTPVRYGAWIKATEEFSDVNRVAGELGIALPEKMGPSPFYSMSTMYTVPDGTTYLEAIIHPAYTWYCIEYGNRELVQEKTREEFSTSTQEYWEVKDAYTLDLGNTDHQLSPYVFHLDHAEQEIKKNGVTNSYPRVEYAGLTLQMDTELVTQKGQDNEFQDNEFYIHSVTWVDSKKDTVFRLSKTMYKNEENASHMPQELVKLAKALVDMNL